MQDNQDSGCGIAAALLLFLLIGFAGFAGATWFYTTSAREQALRLEAQQVRAQAEAARAEAIANQATMEASAEGLVTESTNEADEESAIINLTSEGVIRVEESSLSLEEVRERLVDDAAESYRLIVDRDCRFHHVASLLALFDELGLDRPEVTLNVASD